MNPKDLLNKLYGLAAQNPDLEVVWLYGSRATNTADESSDYDIAVALRAGAADKALFYTDELAAQWSEALGAPISVLDINRAPVPLAYNVIRDGKVLVCASSLRLHSEQSRVWSLWEEYRYEYLKNRT